MHPIHPPFVRGHGVVSTLGVMLGFLALASAAHADGADRQQQPAQPRPPVQQQQQQVGERSPAQQQQQQAIPPQASQSDPDQPVSPRELFSLRSAGGTLALTPVTTARVHAGGRSWATDGATSEYEVTRPGGYFDGRVALRATAARLELGGWRYTYRDWQVVRFTLHQTGREVRAEYTIRTPVGQPDVTLAFAEPNVTLLLIRHPELTPMLGELLAEVSGGTQFDFDPAVHAQVEPASWDEPQGIAQAVRPLVAKLDAPGWRERQAAEDELAALGRDAAMFLLLRLDRHGLSAQQNLAVEQVIRRYPLLTAGDRALCRNDPSRLDPPGRLEDQAALTRAE